MKNEKVNYCFDEKVTRLIGKCNSNCQAINITKKEIHREKLLSVFGSPFFKVCDLYGGTPRIIEIFLLKRWQKTSICIFNDESFIDNASLLGTLD